MLKKEYLIKNDTNMHAFVNDVMGFLYTQQPQSTPHAVVIALQGELGAGKTTFVKKMAFLLGINEHITSPTFIIQKKYTILNNHNFNTLIHIDAYRLRNANELEDIDFNDTLNSNKNLICIEWADNVTDILPKNTLWLKFEHVSKHISENARKIYVKKNR